MRISLSLFLMASLLGGAVLADYVVPPKPKPVPEAPQEPALCPAEPIGAGVIPYPKSATRWKSTHFDNAFSAAPQNGKCRVVLRWNGMENAESKEYALTQQDVVLFRGKSSRAQATQYVELPPGKNYQFLWSGNLAGKCADHYTTPYEGDVTCLIKGESEVKVATKAGTIFDEEGMRTWGDCCQVACTPLLKSQKFSLDEKCNVTLGEVAGEGADTAIE